jgi:hypothetical protein
VLLSGEQCLKGPLHRFSSIEKDAHVSFRLCYIEQAKKDAERLLRGPRCLQSGYLQSQDSDHTSHSRNLLGTAKECCEPLQGSCVVLLSQIDTHQRQVFPLSCLRMERAANWSPAIHPSVRVSRRRISSSGVSLMWLF